MCMDIEKGWMFYSADFSINCDDQERDGCVFLIRVEEDRARWHRMPDDLKDADDGPMLYVVGRGRSFEIALANANLNASKAIPIPSYQNTVTD